MGGNPKVLELLEEMHVSGTTPDEVCRDCPEQLPEVRQRWQNFQIIDAQIQTLLPRLSERAALDTTEPPVVHYHLPADTDVLPVGSESGATSDTFSCNRAEATTCSGSKPNLR